jgi:hypothetical protein
VAHEQQIADRPQHPDLLAAVVLQALLSASPRTPTLEQIILACERDPASQDERGAIEQALRGLIADGLALRQGAHYGATRAALRADALRF